MMKIIKNIFYPNLSDTDDKQFFIIFLFMFGFSAKANIVAFFEISSLLNYLLVIPVSGVIACLLIYCVNIKTGNGNYEVKK